MKLIQQKLDGMDYCTMKNAWANTKTILTDPPTTCVTDGQTDGRAIARSALCICCRVLKPLFWMLSAYKNSKMVQ